MTHRALTGIGGGGGPRFLAPAGSGSGVSLLTYNGNTFMNINYPISMLNGHAPYLFEFDMKLEYIMDFEGL